MEQRDKFIAAAHEMQRTGGGFASALAEAFFRADALNKRKLLAAFGDLFEEYARIALDRSE
jgi:hypothetical protein